MKRSTSTNIDFVSHVNSFDHDPDYASLNCLLDGLQTVRLTESDVVFIFNSSEFSSFGSFSNLGTSVFKPVSFVYSKDSFGLYYISMAYTSYVKWSLIYFNYY